MLVKAPKPATLRYLHERSGLSKVELARRVGISVRELEHWEQGIIARVRSTNKTRLAKALGEAEGELDKDYFLPKKTLGVEINIRALPTAILTQDLKNLIRDTHNRR
jgi:transcriptional regulator with XRE-family HTH domain